MVVPFAMGDAAAAEPHHQVGPCGRCGRRFPYPDSAVPGGPAFCEPCRAAMWAADRHANTDCADWTDGPAPSDTGLAEPAQVVSARQCGRCRELFDGDPSLHARAIAEWWLCDACRAVLFGPSQ